MKRKYLFLYALALSAAAWAQPKIKVDAESRKLGEMMFQMPKTVEYKLQNAGNAPLVINEVHPSCGCINVSFPSTPIAPGENATITAVYDAMMLGTFYRELAVYSNAAEQPLYLSFTGKVVESNSISSIEEEYPISIGDIRLNTNAIEFDDVQKGDRPMAELRVANLGDKDFTPRLMHLPPYLKAEYYPATIRKGRVGKVRLTLDSKELMMDGLNQTSIYMARYLGDRVSPKNEIVISAVRLPDFHGLTASELAKAPNMVLMDGDELVHKADSAMRPVSIIEIPRQGRKRKLSKTIQVTNIGETPLNIRTVQVFNRALGVRLSNRSIPARGTATLKVTVDTRELPLAKAAPRVLIISDDPRHAKVMMNVKLVEAPKK